MPMNIAHTLDFICFFCFRCNGTTVLAEIHRVVMKNRKMYRIEADCFGDSFYQFLYNTANDLFPHVKGVGSCTQNRYTYSSGSNSTDWSDHQQDLLELCNTFYHDPKTVRNKNAVRECTKAMVHELLKGKDPSTKKNRYCGVGAMGAIQFVHMAALLGIIPMQCYTYAELIDNDLGPPKFIRAALTQDETKNKNDMCLSKCNSIFHEVHCEMSNIWGPMITESIVENTLCELSRAYKASSNNAISNTPPVSILFDKSTYADGRTVDVSFFDEQRNCVQNFFILRSQGRDGASEIRPMLVMKHSPDWNGTFEESHITLTNWCCDQKDNKNLTWNDSPQKRHLLTELKSSKKLDQKMKLSIN